MRIFGGIEDSGGIFGGIKGSGGIFRWQIVDQFCIYKSRHLALESSNRVVGLPSL